MKKLLFVLAAIVLAGAAYFVLSKPLALVAEVSSGRAEQLVPGSVTVHAEFQMELKSEAGGRIIRSTLDQGKTVAAGDVLVQLDTTDLELEIERIENEYEAAKRRIAVGSSVKLDLETAAAALANYERLAKRGSYPLVELEKQRRLVKQVEQKVALEEVGNTQLIEGYENTLKVKRRQLEKMTVRAPFEGVVSQVYARVGDLIGGSAPIALLISTTRTVEAKISEENFSGVRVGQKAAVRFLGYGNQLYEAAVTRVMPTADPVTQRYVVHLDVKIEPEKLVPGITGEVTIIVGERESEAIIPRRALLGNSVLVVKDGRVELRKVETGYMSLTAVEVLKGLEAGEQVIVEELDRFQDGDRVRVEIAPAN